MNQKINYLIDTLLVICLLAITITSLVLFFSFQSASPGIERTISFFGTSKKEWLPWHSFFGLAMMILMFLHIILHFNWFKAMTKNLLKSIQK